MSFWTTLDAYMVALIRDEMGVGNSELNGDRLQIKHITQGLVERDRVLDWKGWPKPAAIVMGSRKERTPGYHGDGGVHYDNVYPYVLSFICEGGRADADQDAKVLEARAEAMLATVDQITLGDLSGQSEHTCDVTLGRSDVRLLRVENSNVDRYYGVAALIVEVETSR